MKGFQWFGNYGLNKALNMNSSINGPIDYNYPNDNCDPDTNALNFEEPIHNIKQAYVCHNMAGMQYEPTLELTLDEFNNFKTRAGDPSNPVFGFEHVEGEILTDTSDINYSRLILRDTILNSYAPKNVLSGIVPNPNFWSEFGEYQLHGYSGEIWWLSLNINRLDSDLSTSSDTVLKIRVKYITDSSNSGSIKFNTLPSNLTTNTSELFGYSGNSMQSRGLFRNEIEPFNTDTVIVIKKSMIPSDGTPITISSRFYTIGDDDDHNLYFQGREDTTEKIISLDIEVDYYGNLDVGLDWIRIENIYTHLTLRGELAIPNIKLFIQVLMSLVELETPLVY
jgi:hypothetical protein